MAHELFPLSRSSSKRNGDLTSFDSLCQIINQLFRKQCLSRFWRKDAFSFNIATNSVVDIPVIPRRAFLRLSYVIVLLHWPINTTVFSSNSYTVSICITAALPSFSELEFSIITYNLNNGPIISVILSWIISNVPSIVIFRFFLLFK